MCKRRNVRIIFDPIIGAHKETKSSNAPAGMKGIYYMKKLYYLLYASQTTETYGLRFITTKIIKKSSDIFELQNILHEEYLNALKNQYVVEINGCERDWDWYDEFDEDEYYYDDDDDGDGDDDDGDDKVDYEKCGWPDEPEKLENELTYLDIAGGEITHVMFRVVSDDEIQSA